MTLAHSDTGSWVVWAGSLPRGFTPQRFADAVAATRAAGRLVALDCSGPALSMCWHKRAFGCRIWSSPTPKSSPKSPAAPCGRSAMWPMRRRCCSREACAPCWSASAATVRFSSTPTCRNHCTALRPCAGSSTPWVRATRSSPAGSPPYKAGRRAQTRSRTRCASVPPPSSTRARCSAYPIRAVRSLSLRSSVTDATAALTDRATVHPRRQGLSRARPPDASAYASATRASGTSAVTMSSTRTSPSTRSRIDST